MAEPDGAQDACAYEEAHTHEELRVTVACDEPIVAAGLVQILEAEPGFRVTETRATPASALVDACVETDARIVVYDASEESSSPATLIEGCPHVRVVGLVGADSREHVAEMHAAGAHGLLDRNAAAEEFVAAVRAAARGELYLSQAALRVTRRLLREAGPRPLAPHCDELLSGRERMVVECLVQGMTNVQIAESLGISEATVKSHLGRVMKKWRARDRVQVVLRALDREG